jgi:hypothetical protein
MKGNYAIAPWLICFVDGAVLVLLLHHTIHNMLNLIFRAILTTYVPFFTCRPEERKALSTQQELVCCYIFQNKPMITDISSRINPIKEILRSHLSSIWVIVAKIALNTA